MLLSNEEDFTLYLTFQSHQNLISRKDRGGRSKVGRRIVHIYNFWPQRLDDFMVPPSNFQETFLASAPIDMFCLHN